jgi:outer membrane protein assembly factor BamA
MRYVSTAGNHRFRRLNLDGRVFAPVYHDNILSLQAVLNLTDGCIPIYRRIHIGGIRTLRGYAEGALGGESSLLFSMEYRIPILYERNPMAGMHGGYACVLFFDSANTWFGHQAFSMRGFHSSAGLGLHAIWDDLVIRFEYGYRGKGLGFIVVGSGVKF